MAPAPQFAPNTPLMNRLGRLAWGIAHLLLVRPTLRPMHAWRAAVYRLFGARLGRGCRIFAGAEVWAPWQLQCGDAVAIADGAVVYNVAPVCLGDHATVSQGAYLCTATHDPDDPAFRMTSRPITLGRHAWVAARAVVGPGVRLGDGAVLGLASLTMRDLAAWTVYAGTPARVLRARDQAAFEARDAAARSSAAGEPVHAR